MQYANWEFAPPGLIESPDPFPEPGVLLTAILERKTGEPIIQVFENPRGVQFHASGIGRFWIDPSGRYVRYRVCHRAQPVDLEDAFSGPIFGLALHLRGHVLLHASAVLFDSGAVAFAAPSRLGKSTLAASLARAGRPLLSDDLLILTGGPSRVMAVPVPTPLDGRKKTSSQRLRLWEDSIAAFGEDARDYQLVSSGCTKRQIEVCRKWGSAVCEAYPLSAVYFLEPHLDAGRVTEIFRMDKPAAVLRVMGSMYMASCLRGQRAAHALHMAARMVSTLRIQRLCYYRSYDRLPSLCAAIARDSQAHCGNEA